MNRNGQNACRKGRGKRMIKEWMQRLRIWQQMRAGKGIGDKTEQYTTLSVSLTDNMVYFSGEMDQSVDFVHRELTFAGHHGVLMYIDNMIDKVVLTESVLNPLAKARPARGSESGDPFFTWVRDCVLGTCDQHEVFTREETMWQMMSGFAMLLIDGYPKALAFGFQGFKIRSIGEPNIDRVIRGSREGFTEAIRINLMMLRRRMKTADLKFETYVLGSQSKTEICLCYIKDAVAPGVLAQMRRHLRTINIDILLASGFIQPYFQDNPLSLFSTVGYTERPDSLAAKLSEGRIGILVDGTPMALFAPYLLSDNFSNIDDYATSYYYGTFTRVLKFISFLISVFLPGLYVAVGSFHQELLPTPLLYTLAQSEQNTPFTLTVEALLMQVIYEALREAGLRAPRQLGSALNIVGAFLIGQAAVSAGLIGAPMVIIVALTATTSLVVPTLYEPSIIMRFAYILLAGMSGFYGMAMGFSFFMLVACGTRSYGTPYTAPYAPTDWFAMRDNIFRAPWNVLMRKKVHPQDLNGSDTPK